MGLTVTDLLKNYLFSLAGQSEVDLRLIREQWQRIIDITDLDSFPTFLRHYWNSRREIVRKESLFKVIKKSVGSRQGAFDLLDELESAAGLYQALAKPSDEMWQGDKALRRSIRELELFRVTQCYPLLLITYQKLPAQFERVLRIAVVLSFRYNVIAGLNPNRLEEAYNRVAQQIARDKLNNATQIAEALRDVYPSDEEFKNAFSTASFNSKRHRKLIRYILYELENQLAGSERDFEDESATIEHILPENPDADWAQAFDSEDHKRFVYRLGNYTLLEAGKNRDCQNRSFAEKRAIYQTSQYQLAKRIEYEDWNPNTLRSRQDALARVASAVWRI